jgi:uncharacterized membrane protein YgaE (UPF0421/DUF939 family)
MGLGSAQACWIPLVLVKPVAHLVNPVTRLRQSSRTPLLQVLKTAVAVVAAVLLCTVVLPGPFPTFGAIAALLVVQPSINQSFVKGLERSAGVVLGVLLSTGLHLLLGDATWVVLLAIVVAILLAWALRLTPTSATQVAISGMLVLTAGVVTPHYSLDRIIETVLGAIVALVVNALIVPPVLLQPAHLAVSRLARDTAAAFERIALGLTDGASRATWDEYLVTARTLRQAMARSDAAIAAARESLTMNPRGSRNRTVLERDVVVAGHLFVIVTRVIGMTRAIRDNVTPDLPDDLTIGRIATEVARIAVDVRALGGSPVATRSPVAAGAGTGRAGAAGAAGAAGPGVVSSSEEPALTTPIAVVRPNEEHWILIGSLLEDIRRVREELLGEGA